VAGLAAMSITAPATSSTSSAILLGLLAVRQVQRGLQAMGQLHRIVVGTKSPVVAALPSPVGWTLSAVFAPIAGRSSMPPPSVIFFARATLICTRGADARPREITPYDVITSEHLLQHCSPRHIGLVH